MKVLVTGISGHIGQVVARGLLARGHEVWGIDRRPWPDAPAGVRMFAADIRKRAAEDVFRKAHPEAVIHMATVTHLTSQSEDRYRINLVGTRAVFEHSHDLLVLGDGAFHSPALEPVLHEKHRVEVFAPPRRDSRKRQPWSKAKRRFLGRVRRKIETAFSVLQTVFHIEQPNARSLRGVICRMSTRLLAYNLCFVTGNLLRQLGAKPTPN